MSEEQLSALLAKLKDDEALLEKFKCTTDLDTAVELAKTVGFDVSKADLFSYHAKQTLELSDQALEGVTGGNGGQVLLDDNSNANSMARTFGEIMKSQTDVLQKLFSSQ